MTKRKALILLAYNRHKEYFYELNAVLPTVYEDRFRDELRDNPLFVPSQALCFALGALGSLIREDRERGDDQIEGENSFVGSDALYTQARGLLDMCEREGNGAGLTSIDTLQAFLMVAFYELQRPNLSRAWMTLGRAIRLSKLMGLHQMDSNTLPTHTANTAEAHMRSPMWTPHPSASLPGSDCPFIVEERRRAYWHMYILDSFAGISMQIVPALEEVS